jgi:hypothetical protein
MSLRRPTRPWLQPLTSGRPNMRPVRERTVLGVLAEPPQIARFRSIIRTEEVDHDEPNHLGSPDSGQRTAPQTLPGRTLARRRLSKQEFPTFDGL